jgi:hypothetical protein
VVGAAVLAGAPATAVGPTGTSAAAGSTGSRAVAAGPTSTTAAAARPAGTADAAPRPTDPTATTGDRPATGADAVAPGCIVRDATGSQVWYGSAGRDAARLGGELQQVADDHPDHATAVIFCSHYEGALISLPAGDPTLEPVVRSIAASHPGLTVAVLPVASALAPLLKLQHAIFSSPRLHGVVVGAGPDAYTGGLRLEVERDASMSRADVVRAVSRLAASIVGGDVPVSIDVTASAGANAALDGAADG